MVDRLSATPLIALDAVVADTETTDLEPARARIVEIAGVRLHGGRLDASNPYRTLVDPGEAIPALATKIHGIDAKKVAGSPRFPAAWQGFVAFAGEAVLIGHHTGYDLAVIARECARAGVAFDPPRSLCVRVLAEAVRPDLPGYSLEQLAEWLGVTIERSPFGARRRARDGRDFPEAHPDLARARRPHALRSRGRDPFAIQRARGAAARRLARAGASAFARGERAHARADRFLPLPPSRARRDVEAAGVRAAVDERCRTRSSC